MNIRDLGTSSLSRPDPPDAVRGLELRERLRQARLYVLVDGRDDDADFRNLVISLVTAGVHVLQLRDKQMADRQLVGRARLLRQLTLGTGTLCIINDRPDVALLADADGVHVGQDELSVEDVRRVLGRDRLVGVSTHSVDQAREAVSDGADYLGCGPTFPSQTKAFGRFAGLAFLRQLAGVSTVPAFAIGGIKLTNLPSVLEAGIRRVAVSGEILASPAPAAAASRLLAEIEAWEKKEGGNA